MDIIIRSAEISDSREICRLTNELGYLSPATLTSEWLNSLLESNVHAAIVASSNKRSLFGWIVVEKRLSLETGFKAEISGLIVSSSNRRKGIGVQLVTAAEVWAVQVGLSYICVRSNIKRDGSHTFYKKNGFCHKKTAHKYEKLLHTAID